MHGMYVKGKLCVYIYMYIYKYIYLYMCVCVYQDARYIREGKSTYLHYKCIKMHGIYVKGTLCIYVNVSRCTVCM